MDGCGRNGRMADRHADLVEGADHIADCIQAGDAGLIVRIDQQLLVGVDLGA